MERGHVDPLITVVLHRGQSSYSATGQLYVDPISHLRGSPIRVDVEVEGYQILLPIGLDGEQPPVTVPFDVDDLSA